MHLNHSTFHNYSSKHSFIGRREMDIFSQKTPIKLLAYDHVGIRVSNKQKALSFYQSLGFIETASFPDYEANEMMSEHGVRINLIFNGSSHLKSQNVLHDSPVKLPGITHPAFIVDDIGKLKNWLNTNSIHITEGPKAIGPRRIALFIRDPDGNVLEFNQLVSESNNGVEIS
ncbi:hypothetical protein ABKPCSM17A_02332 [Acinetobacter baumannii]|nr:hypothetical protein ABKPCSM17A_02332 [Acinetobacter baumannii]